MKKPSFKPTAIIAAVLGLALAMASVSTANAQGACLDKRQIQEAVASGQIMSLDAVLATAGIDGNQEILSVQVCDEGGQLVYIIGVLSPDGQAQNFTVAAQ